ncbi:MAG: hypothetical protein QXL96_11985 [Ignisphaera sp.]
MAEASNYLQELGKDLDIVLDALDYLSGGWSISRYPVINGQEINTPSSCSTLTQLKDFHQT